MKIFIRFISLCFIALLLFHTILVAQNTNNQTYSLNTISTAVPFLRIASDARSGGMGDVGIAISPDANSIFWNPSKLAFAKDAFGISASYTPWLRQLVSDIYLANLSGYNKIGQRQTFGLSLVYFDMGSIQFTNMQNLATGDFNPREFSASIVYARQLSDHFSTGLALKYIYSNLASGQSVSGVEIHAGKAAAADVSFFYQNNLEISEKPINLAIGTNISNIGSKISYTESVSKDFIPINLGIGTAVKIPVDDFNEITVSLDINKLLVPTPDPNDSLRTWSQKPVVLGMVGSFTDAPGGFTEELHELTYSAGAEYWYSRQFAVRAGFFSEHSSKGNRKYMTAGLGLKFNVFGLDVSYLIPANTQPNPLDNTLRFTLVFDFANLKTTPKKPLKE